MSLYCTIIPIYNCGIPVYSHNCPCHLVSFNDILLIIYPTWTPSYPHPFMSNLTSDCHFPYLIHIYNIIMLSMLLKCVSQECLVKATIPLKEICSYNPLRF